MLFRLYDGASCLMLFCRSKLLFMWRSPFGVILTLCECELLYFRGNVTTKATDDALKFFLKDLHYLSMIGFTEQNPRDSQFIIRCKRVFASSHFEFVLSMHVTAIYKGSSR